jgi:hypothetical protein
MEQADFIHLVRLSEQESAQDSKAYRRGLAAFAALGYAWVIGCMVLAIVTLSFTISAIWNGQFKSVFLWGLVAAAGLLWTCLRALWCPRTEAEGVRITAAEAPALFEALESLRKKIKGPAIHEVRLDSELNASISQHPRFGLFGGAVNYLTIGLPLLMAMDRQRLLTVLAHEYGHLRGDYGRFAAWIYRARLSWAKLDDRLRDDDGPVAAAMQAFLRWYFPRFLAKTFALAREDEYEADRISGKLLGKEAACAALIEIEVKDAWIGREFWSAHWSGAASSPTPIGPYAAMAKLLALPPPGDFARDALRQALRRISDMEDTHPVLRERLEALEGSKSLPVWSAKSALGLLGDGGEKWIAHFDKHWCKDNASDWKRHHAYLGRVQAAVRRLAVHVSSDSAGALVELAGLHRRLREDGQSRELYERALRFNPSHAGALRGIVSCLPATEHAARMQHLEALFESSMADRWWASRMAIDALEEAADGNHDEKALKLWRDRLGAADDAEERGWDEHADTPFFQSISRHDLSEFEIGEVRAGLVRFGAVVRAWLVCKKLREFPHRRSYLMFVDLPGMEDGERYDLCRELESSLDLPGRALVLWAGHSPTVEDIAQHAFEPIYSTFEPPDKARRAMGQSPHAS